MYSFPNLQKILNEKLKSYIANWTNRLIITYDYFLIVCIIDFCEVLIHYSLAFNCV